MLLGCEGKGFLGCMAAIVLIAAMIFAGIKLGPIYYANYMFEEDLKNITSQAGARGKSHDEIILDILNAAKKRNIRITPEDAKRNVSIERYAGQIHVNVKYLVPVDFMIYRTTMQFEIKNSSFTAA